MDATTKHERLKQVQFRMPPDVHKELRKLLIDQNISMADLFNQAAVDYIAKYKKEMQAEAAGGGIHEK